MPWISNKRLEEIERSIATLGAMCDFAMDVAKSVSTYEARIGALEACAYSELSPRSSKYAKQYKP